jgi:hypothetical protein
MGLLVRKSLDKTGVTSLATELQGSLPQYLVATVLGKNGKT